MWCETETCCKKQNHLSLHSTYGRRRLASKWLPGKGAACRVRRAFLSAFSLVLGFWNREVNDQSKDPQTSQEQNKNQQRSFGAVAVAGMTYKGHPSHGRLRTEPTRYTFCLQHRLAAKLAVLVTGWNLAGRRLRGRPALPELAGQDHDANAGHHAANQNT